MKRLGIVLLLASVLAPLRGEAQVGAGPVCVVSKPSRVCSMTWKVPAKARNHYVSVGYLRVTTMHEGVAVSRCMFGAEVGADYFPDVVKGDRVTITALDPSTSGLFALLPKTGSGGAGTGTGGFAC